MAIKNIFHLLVNTSPFTMILGLIIWWQWDFAKDYLIIIGLFTLILLFVLYGVGMSYSEKKNITSD